MPTRSNVTRRRLLETAMAAAFLSGSARLFADELLATAALTEGPFYPDKLPLDTDNDLLIINDSITPAVGEITHLSGRLLSPSGEPIRNAFIEIWQVDNRGAYLHSRSSNREQRDANFQGYGRFLTDAKGQYYFRTIKPVAYPGRTPHIHFGISQNGRRIFTTQLLVKGHPQNDKDGVFREIRDAKSRETVMADFQPLAGSIIGELVADFDIILGHTLEEGDDGKLHGGIGRPKRRGG
ncbi:MAG: intradiol ring-cleavage dioxygenase [Planctomycetales bacterium]|nr:intradiol ring-cleavage dioxygenase [Planctomycetales bacterium]